MKNYKSYFWLSLAAAMSAGALKRELTVKLAIVGPWVTLGRLEAIQSKHRLAQPF
jgi:hypothetical protein